MTEAAVAESSMHDVEPRPSVLDLEDVSVVFHGLDKRPFRAVNSVRLNVAQRETVGLVGESGCGKSTLARAALGLVPVASGTVRLLGRDLSDLKRSEIRGLRRHAQMIFQDPRGSLDPRMSIEDIIAEPLRVHGLASGRDRTAKVSEMMELVGLPESLRERRPSQLSGGQQQRVGIARALITEPALVVCDEPVSALDVSIRAQIMNLLSDLRDALNVAFLFIAHDLAVVRHLSDRVVVMYLGQVVEEGPADDLFSNPRHPYTQGLVAAILHADKGARDRLELVEQLASGDLPSPVDPPPGCTYHTRCPYAVDDPCRTKAPRLAPVSGAAPSHHVSCHLVDEIPEIPVQVR